MRILHVGDDFIPLRRCGLTLYSDALMKAQAAGGHHVSYVFSGRVYPGLARPRLKRWRHGAVRMYELIGSPNHSHWEIGTRYPLRDLDEPAGEAAFDTALREARPEIVHIHELARLPSSVIERAKAARLPVVMSLYDYKPLCAAVRLLDADGQRCLKRDVGHDCARNCARAPEGPWHLIDWTLRFERQRARGAIPLLRAMDFSKLNPVVGRTMRLLSGWPAPNHPPGGNGARTRPDAEPSAESSPSDYQRRRDVNLQRLELCDRLLAMSMRVADVYATLGVDRRRISVQRFTLPHLEDLKPRRGPGVQSPVTFVAPGSCASESKGSRAVLEAVRRLEESGRGEAFRLLIPGSVEPAVEGELARMTSVSMLGSYAPQDLDQMLDEADIGIVPSIWEEAFGFVGVEMLAKGLPLIGSALGGIPEYVIEGETGWLNRSASGTELAELMARAIENPREVERLRGRVQARRSEFVRPMSAHVAEVEVVYAELTSVERNLPAARP